MEILKKNEKPSETIIFHGGCHGCTNQLIQTDGIDYCVKCMYLDGNYSLPNLNNKPPTFSETMRTEIKKRNKLKSIGKKVKSIFK